MSEALITMARDLHRRKGRERRQLTLAEGVRLVEEALRAGIPLRGVLTGPALETTPRGRALATELRVQAIPHVILDAPTYASVASTEHSQGIVAVVALPTWTLTDIRWGTRGVVLLVDGVQDPGNLGGILRSAWGLGAAGVIVLSGTVDPTNPKVLRGGMGASFHLPVVSATLESATTWLATEQVELWVATADGEPIQELSPGARLAIAVGNEGVGGSAILQEHAARQVGIPLRGGVDSLNVAIASALLLYEVTRVF